MKAKITPDKNRAAAEDLINTIRKRRRRYVARVNGRDYEIYPDVFSPALVLDTAWYAKHLPSQKGKSVLEIGAGTGVLAITAALQGASSVLAVDINPHAVANTSANVKRHSVEDVVATHKSDVYKNISIKTTFDTIMWNVPWGDFAHGEKLNWIQKAFYDPGYTLLRRFVFGAKRRLNKNGTLLIGFSSSIGSEKTLRKYLKEAGFTCRIRAKNKHRFAVGHPAGPIQVEWFEAKLR
ncbi:MAG: methyltransferase [Patescibacteria group bacterium]